MDLGKEIRAKREAAGMSRDQLADALAEKGVRVHRNTIYNWEGGVREPRYKHLLALRDVLGIRLNGKEDEDAACGKRTPHPRG